MYSLGEGKGFLVSHTLGQEESGPQDRPGQPPRPPLVSDQRRRRHPQNGEPHHGAKESRQPRSAADSGRKGCPNTVSSSGGVQG